MNKKDFAIGTLIGGLIAGGTTFAALKEYFSEANKAKEEEIRSHYISEIDKLREELVVLRKAVSEEIPKEAEEVSEKNEDELSREQQEAYETARQNYSAISEEKKPKKEKKAPNRPYCITPEQYQIESQYAKVTLDWWNENGVFTNLEGEVEDEAGVWTDIENTISRVGDYEEDTLYVRNDMLQTDYEIYFHADEWGGAEE